MHSTHEHHTQRPDADRLRALIDDIRSRVGDAISDEALDHAFDALDEAVSDFGWTDRQRHRTGRPEHGHHRHGHRGRGAHVAKLARFGQRSYERGFDAGFARGRES